MDGPNSPALEKYREERAAIARLTRVDLEGQLVDRDEVRQSMQKAAPVIRQAGEALQKQFGPLASQILYEADHWKTWVHQRLKTPLGTLGGGRGKTEILLGGA